MKGDIVGALLDCDADALRPVIVEPLPAFIIKVKAANSATDDLKVLARDALAQIDGKKYDDKLFWYTNRHGNAMKFRHENDQQKVL